MNTNWEETFDEEFSLNKCGERWIDGTLLDSLNGLRQDIKAFIKSTLEEVIERIPDEGQPTRDFDPEKGEVTIKFKVQLRKEFLNE